MKKTVITFGILLLALTACKKEDNTPAPAENDHIVGSSAIKYTEADEAGNSASSTAEATSYVLDTTGIVISGSFEAASPTTDWYKFSTSTFSKVDVQVFVNGVKEEEANHTTSLSLKSFVYNGYSSLMGNGYFIRAWVESGKDYVISITGTAGKTYTLEMKGE